MHGIGYSTCYLHKLHKRNYNRLSIIIASQSLLYVAFKNYFTSFVVVVVVEIYLFSSSFELKSVQITFRDNTSVQSLHFLFSLSFSLSLFALLSLFLILSKFTNSPSFTCRYFIFLLTNELFGILWKLCSYHRTHTLRFYLMPSDMKPYSFIVLHSLFYIFSYRVCVRVCHIDSISASDI